MSQQESKSKKELSDKELQNAAGGADYVPGDSSGRTPVAESIADPTIWIDVEANINDFPPTTPTAGSGSTDVTQILSEEREEP